MKLTNVEDIYPLSPTQQGMLFHTLLAPGQGLYFNQFHCTLRGALDPAAFRRAWQQVVNREAVLRSAFVWQELDEPLQIVRREVTPRWQEHDWRGVPAAEQRVRIERF